MKVSVIVPTYNRPETLVRAVDSIKNQTYKDLEIIIVDDCSSLSVPIIQGTTYVRLSQNSGFHARPRNVGIKLARGKYICYLDDDDEYLPNHVEVLVNAIESGDYDFAYGRRQYCNENGSVHQSALFTWQPERACDPFWLGTCDILHTKKIAEKLGGWNEDAIRYGDYELGCRLGRFGATGIAVDEIITNCYSVDLQMTNDPKRQGFDARDYALNVIKQKWLKY